MARISTRAQFRCYVLSKLGSPLLDLAIQTGEIDPCDTTPTTGTTGTTGTSSTTDTNTLYTSGSGTTPNCEILANSVCSQLDLAIDDALDYFQNYSSNIGNEKAILYVQLVDGQTYYDVPPCVISIEQAMSRGSTYQFDAEEAGEAVGLFSLQSQFGPRGVFSYLGAGTYDTLLTYEIAWQYNALIDLRYTLKFEIDFLDLERKIMVMPTPSRNDNGHVLPFMCNIKVIDEKCFNHLWVQRYAVALAMEQIGRNLSMYSGFQLPGGGSFNSDWYWTMGREDKVKLEEELRTGAYGNGVSGGFFLTG